MKDFWISLVRSIVPAVVTAIAGYLAQWGISVDATGIGGLEAALFALGYGLYYAAVRLLETHVTPKLGWLLGHPAAPQYLDPGESITNMEAPTAAQAK